jgi:hypothetical protein
MSDAGRYLYRALRRDEIAQRVLIPKEQEPFAANPRLGIDTRLPFTLGPTPEHAVRQHQWQQRGFPTRGVSTTPHLHRARLYAKHRVIAVVSRNLLPGFGIEEFAVNDWLGRHPEDIACAEDEEVILVAGTLGPLPAEIIERLVNLDDDVGSQGMRQEIK